MAVIIPAFNEAESLSYLIPRIPSEVGRVIVVDNASTDKTAKIASDLGADVVSELRQGYGNAVLSGMAHARLNKFNIGVVMDADASNDPESIPELVGPILNDFADLVIAQRTKLAEPDALLPHQKFGNNLTVALMKLFGSHYTDLGPFRALRLETMQRMELSDPSYGWNIEMQFKATRHGLRIKEIELPYYRRKFGQSKISGEWKASLKAGVTILRSVWKYK